MTVVAADGHRALWQLDDRAENSNTPARNGAAGGRGDCHPAWMSDAEPVESTEHYDNGALKLTGFLLDGEMHGPWSFYRRDGSLMRAGSFERGRQVGRWQTYDRTGQVVKETAFPDAG